MGDGEKKYMQGYRAAMRRIAVTVFSELLPSDALRKDGHALAERSATVEVLRRICAKHGDNDWPDDLYLPDVLEKHLDLDEDEEDGEAT